MSVNQWVVKTKKIASDNNIKISDLAKGIGMSEPNLYKCFKRGSIELKNLELIANYFKVPITYFLDDKPIVNFGEGFEKQRAGATLGERIEVIGRNLTRAEEWMENVEFLKHENEELRAMVESQQRTIQAHEATIAAMRESMQLLKRGK